MHDGRSGPVGRGPVMVRRMRAFSVAKEGGRRGVSVAAALANSSAASLPGMPLWHEVCGFGIVPTAQDGLQLPRVAWQGLHTSVRQDAVSCRFSRLVFPPNPLF